MVKMCNVCIVFFLSLVFFGSFMGPIPRIFYRIQPKKQFVNVLQSIEESNVYATGVDESFKRHENPY